MKRFFLLLAPLLMLVACNDDPEVTGPLPEITWVMSSGRFRIQTGESIQLVPDIENLDETSVYVWTIEGKVVGHDNYYTFTTDTPGEYFVKLTINNRFGKVEDEVKITVTENTNVELPEIPDLVIGRQLLKDGGIFVFEHGKDYDFSNHPHFLEHRSYGSVNFSLFTAAERPVG